MRITQSNYGPLSAKTDARGHTNSRIIHKLNVHGSVAGGGGWLGSFVV